MLSLCRRVPPLRAAAARAASQHSATTEEQFQPLDVSRRREVVKKARQRRSTAAGPPRYERQSTTQRWSDVWPAPRSFHPAAVPLPLRQGFVERPALYVTPGKYANAELMKVANMLHLTPPAVERHCKALARFCTAWPAALTDERLEQLRPLRVVTQDFVHATPTVRHPDARVVAVRLPVDRLLLTPADRDKLLRLVGERFDVQTGLLTLVADRCPYRRQNRDYALYLLTVLYFESCKREPWEALRVDADAEEFVWEGSTSQAAVRRLGTSERWLGTNAGQAGPTNGRTGTEEAQMGTEEGQAVTEETQLGPEESAVVREYAKAVTQLHNVGEDEASLAAYRRAVVALLSLPEHVAAH
ncbi:28S ribosomal protein S35, mitochondrial-like [Pollicipes pollicipes]|uniref:28S ribosomal protein S35, mitochondrial-like n=1 Tax=Pollicipes pollicipes TaxID=41117 RepID=UPI001884B4C2|nr:28S ribosomal protein S35, mitochondrial-like [Pollicipes pollicipes]XP_037093937.1 28S ribosomal protein S35, mitochondrial-like [Pollicipes pollicipes]XP_037093938.1 28S ribosomal protein S35, mitochondrial-like [Pollicipes pollicipes]